MRLHSSLVFLSKLVPDTLSDSSSARLSSSLSHKHTHTVHLLSSLSRPFTSYIHVPTLSHTEFLVIEDLTRHFRLPCVLDIKIGFRQHGLDAPPDKIRRMIDRSATTTSGSHGFKITGAKWYRVDENRYRSRGKEDGRATKPEALLQELAACFHNGVSLRTDVLKEIIPRVEV